MYSIKPNDQPLAGKSYYPALVDLLKTHCPRGGNLLEVGCGEGAFLVHARQNGLRFFGYDVHEHAGLDGERATRLRGRLSHARIDQEDVKWVGARDPIPSPTESVDLALSIQVLEHVADLNHLFGELRRVLKPGGTAIHYFPTCRILVDPHSGVPFCHWSRRWRRTFLGLGAGLGKYPSYRADRGYSRAQFVDEFDRYLGSLVHYRSISQIVQLSKTLGLTTRLTGLSGTNLGTRFHPVCQFFTSIVLIQRKPGDSAGLASTSS